MAEIWGVVPPPERQPTLRCKLLGHLWTKAPIFGGRPARGAWIGRDALGPYCSRCFHRRAAGDRGRTGDSAGLFGDGGRLDYSDEVFPPTLSRLEESR